MSTINGLGSASAAQYASLFNSIDKDQDGKVTRAEFVSGAPQGVNSDAAGSLFDSLDSQHSGSINESDFASAFQQMSSSMQAMMIDLQGSGQVNGGRQGLGSLFSRLDTDGDGKVSKDEFVSGRPKGMSEDDAGKMFNSLSNAAGVTDGSALSQDQFAQALQSQGPQGAGTHHPHHHHGGGGMNPDEIFAKLDTDGNGKVSKDEFVAGRPQNVSEDQASTFFDQIAQSEGVDGSDGLTKDQLSNGFKAEAQSQAQASQSASGTNSTDPGQLLDQLLAALQSADPNGTGVSSGLTPGQSLDQFMQAITAYSSSALNQPMTSAVA